MASVAVKYFRNEIEQITKIIEETKLVSNIVLQAKLQDLEKIQREIVGFYQEYIDEYYRILEFIIDYEDEKYPIIFGNDVKYDRTKIRGISLVCLCAISDESLSTHNMFCDIKVLQETLRAEGYEQLANYIRKEEINSLESLIAAFKEK